MDTNEPVHQLGALLLRDVLLFVHVVTLWEGQMLGVFHVVLYLPAVLAHVVHVIECLPVNWLDLGHDVLLNPLLKTHLSFALHAHDFRQLVSRFMAGYGHIYLNGGRQAWLLNHMSLLLVLLVVQGVQALLHLVVLRVEAGLPHIVCLRVHSYFSTWEPGLKLLGLSLFLLKGNILGLLVVSGRAWKRPDRRWI